MTVTAIAFHDLTIPVEDPKLQAALAPLDRDGDRRVSPADFARTDVPEFAQSTDDVFATRVAEAFAQSGQVTNRQQFHAVKDFFSLYQRIALFNERTSLWYQNNETSWFGYECEFDSSFWNQEVLPYIAPEGALAPQALSAMALDLFVTLRAFEGVPVDRELVTDRLTIAKCKKIYRGLTFTPGKMPSTLRDHIVQMSQRYTASARWLFQFSELECVGSACPEIDEVSNADILYYRYAIPMPGGPSMLLTHKTACNSY